MGTFDSYQRRLADIPNITPVGRLGTYRYLDMDQVIGEALDLASDTVTSLETKSAIPQKIRPRTK